MNLFQFGIIATVLAGLASAQTAKQIAEIKQRIQQAELFDFGKVKPGGPIEHTFQFRNTGPATLEIAHVQVTPPLTVKAMTRQVRPDATGTVTVRLGEPREPGDFEGLVVVNFSGKEEEKFFRVQGRVVRPIDFDPMPAFFVTAFKGESKHQSIEVANYRDEPLKLELAAGHSTSRFTSELRELEPGRRYRLTVMTAPGAPAGKTRDVLSLRTSSPEQPTLEIPVNTQIRNRVYTFPESVMVGLIEVSDLKQQPRLAEFLSHSVMVYQRGGTDFQIHVESDVPFLKISLIQDSLKDRYEIRTDIIPEKLEEGRYNGFIRIATNDPEFPKLAVPITVQVKGNW